MIHSPSRASGSSSPSRIPLPASPDVEDARRLSNASSVFAPSPLVSPRSRIRPRLSRGSTSLTVRQTTGPTDPFLEGSTISVNQPVGSLSISPSNRDVCLASRKGLYILDLANLNNAPRFIPQGGTWQIADCQWSPHAANANLILSTSSQKLLVWDLAAAKALHSSIEAHSRAITDINWHAHDPNRVATASMDAGIRGWDLRMGDKPYMRLSAWGQAGTQVKCNRQHGHIIATAHGKEAIIWDDRKGSIPLVVIRGHDSKVYGIDWDRQYRHKIVTCSLDKTIKLWSVPELASEVSADVDYTADIPSPTTPKHTIVTNYPVWRARNLPFGRGVLALPQRGEKSLEMFGTDVDLTRPIESFEGHDDVVKEFVWRTRGGQDVEHEDREFQLVTWSKDRTLKIWPVPREVTEKFGYRKGQPIKVLLSRRGAKDMTYTRIPEHDESTLLPPPIVNPSGIARQKLGKPEVGMTRGGGKTRGVDQLEWLTKVVKTKSSPRHSPDSSLMTSRAGSRVRTGSKGESLEGISDLMSLKDEVVLVNKIFPRPRINFEKIDLHHGKLTMSMNGPWANGDRMAFIRIHWTIPHNYPYAQEHPTFILERNPTVSPIVRQKMVSTIQQIRSFNRQCLVATSSFLLGSGERMSRRILDAESDSDSEKDVNISNAPMLMRNSGATFGPNGQLVCFFPKQTVLPRTRHQSKSPSGARIGDSAMFKAMTALTRMENPKQRRHVQRTKPRLRHLDTLPVPVQAGSTLTIHDVSNLGSPSLQLAKAYGASVSPSANMEKAIEAKRLDHAHTWSSLIALLSDPPPPYSVHPPRDGELDHRAARLQWEKDVLRKRVVIRHIFAGLVERGDVQLLALVACSILNYSQQHPPPPVIATNIAQSPEQDYFGLPAPSVTSAEATPTRRRSRPSLSLASPGLTARTTGWSQILSASSASLRGAMTPTRRTSVEFPPKTPLATSFEEGVSPETWIPVPQRKDKGTGVSPRMREKQRSGPQASASPPNMTALRPRSSGKISGEETGLSGDYPGTSGPSSHHGTSHGSTRHLAAHSPLKNVSLTAPSVAAAVTKKRKARRVCGVRIDLEPQESIDEMDLLDPDMLIVCEMAKLAYADFLLRFDLYTIRAQLLNYRFLRSSSISSAASGVLLSPDAPMFPVSESDVSKTITSCIACASQAFKCTACARNPQKPACSFCHLPIKGLAVSCMRCSHRQHSKCFKKHFAQPGFSSAACPSCLCKCVAEGGVTISNQTLQPVVAPVATYTRGLSRPSINPLLSSAAGRMTYASLKTIREHDTPGDASALGLSPEGEHQSALSMIGERTAAGSTGPSGWLGWDGKLAWGHRDDAARSTQQHLPSTRGHDSPQLRGDGEHSRPPSRESEKQQRSRPGSSDGPNKGKNKDGPGRRGRLGLSAFRSGDAWRQSQT